jgi:adenine-specific DNA-methyltransferase
MDLFADFNGIPEGATGTDFYQHDANWTNRLILGDSLQVMASLAEREGLRGKVQCIYIDPPYGIKFNSNFQWSTTSRDVRDKTDHITREPEQVKAFRDTWRDGLHSYMTYLLDRFKVAQDLLASSGSIFVQIGDENVHFVRSLLDEVFGRDNFVSDIVFAKTVGQTSDFLPGITDHCLWYARQKDHLKYRTIYKPKVLGGEGTSGYRLVELRPFDWRPLTKEEKEGFEPVSNEGRLVAIGDLSSQRQGRASGQGSAMHFPIAVNGSTYYPSGTRGWSTTEVGIRRLIEANRVYASGGGGVGYVRYLDDYSVMPLTNIWTDTVGQSQYGGAKTYVVQTGVKVVERCILMTTDPGDLVLDPTCGSGTTATVAEQWGRRWITIDTSRVALALARARIMGARYPYYLLADSKAGQAKEAELRRTLPSSAPTYGDIRHGFVYERVPHIMLKDIANNAEIDVIWETYQAQLEPLRAEINRLAGQAWQEWEMPRVTNDERRGTSDNGEAVDALLAQWWDLRIARQREIDASIAANAEQEYLYDKPYSDNGIVRVAGPFTVESLSPHRVMAVDADDELRPLGSGAVFGPGHTLRDERAGYHGNAADFATMVLENLRTAGVQQAHKEGRIHFSALSGWPGQYIAAEGRYIEEETGIERRAGIFIGPEFGTVARPDLVLAAREAADAGFDVVIACAFNYDAHSAEFERLGRIPILKARMNADLHMAGDLANTGAGNLFVIFGEPDIDIQDAPDGRVQVEIRGVDIFHPQSGEVRSSGPDDIACWFIDTDYNAESFFVRQAYFLGMNDPYSALKTTLKADIDEEAWESLYSAVSRPFDKPGSGRIAVKVINHLGDEVMKVFSIGK